ncbi:hypothetical protein [Nonomuraea dietziae]|uniref:hypothetical protein n=1 Tax=Nonomuraea dietziae TaxID=65515 RepID=UPI00340AF133
MTTPTGGATWGDLAADSAGFDTQALRLWEKTAGSSEPSSYTFAKISSTTSTVIIVAVQDPGAGSSLVATSTTGSGTGCSTPSVNATRIGELEIRFATAIRSGATTWTPPAGYSELREQSGGDVHSTAASRSLTATGATGALTFTASGTLSARIGVSVVVPSPSLDATVDIPAPIDVPVTMPTPDVSAGASATPATIAAVTAMPAPDTSAGAGATPATIAVGATMPTPAVTTQNAEIVTPDTIAVPVAMPGPSVQANAAAHPAAIAVPVAMPSPALRVDASVTLSTIAVRATMPSPIVGVPALPGDRITRAGQIEWNGFLLGSGTPYSWQELEGWRDTPPWISGNVDQPSANGSYPGQGYYGERIINWATLLKAPVDQVGQLLRDLQMATGRSQTEEEGTLVVWDFDDAEPYLVYGHLSQRAPGKIDRKARLGLMRGALQWTCSGPEIYSVIRQSLPIPIDTEMDVLNDGNEASPSVVYRIPGPCTVPQIENLTLDRVFGFDVEILAGEVLEIDVKNGNVVIGSTDHLNTLIEGSTSVKDMVFAPGPNRLVWSAETGGTLMNVLWRHAST